MVAALEMIFWFAVGWIVYAYAGYPVVSLLASWFVKKPADPRPIEPTVSLLIAAYNEEKDIEEKLVNSLLLDYPRERLQIVVASDGSTDRTDEIVRAFAARAPVQVVLHRVEGRVGKTGAQNSAVEVCTGEIIVFSDAASMYEPGAVRALVGHYANPEVGAVSGRYEYKVKREAVGGGRGPRRTFEVGLGTRLFWKLENFIKTRQSRLGTLTGASGCIYSLRRALYVPLPNHVVSDLVEPLMVLRQGYRIAFEPAALAWEETAGGSKDELRMRIRVIVGGMFGLAWALSRIDPRRHAFAWVQLLSHKVTRWLVPVFAIVAFVASAALAPSSTLHAVALALQVAFLALAGLGWVLERMGVRMRPLAVPLWLCLTNWASLVSLGRVLRGANIVVWQPVRK